MGVTEEIKRILESLKISSAGGNNPVENTVISIGELPDLDEIIKQSQQDDPDFAKENKRIDTTIKKVEAFDNGKIGEINRFTSQQMGNLRGFVDNPIQFIMQTVFRKFAKGAGIIAFALIIFEAVKWIISELLKPGRLLDIRFKRDINKELIAFRQREDQQRIKQGFSNIIITTTPRLRGGQGQATNTLNMASGREKFPDNIGQSSIMLEASGVSFSKSKGRQRFRA